MSTWTDLRLAAEVYADFESVVVKLKQRINRAIVLDKSVYEMQLDVAQRQLTGRLRYKSKGAESSMLEDLEVIYKAVAPKGIQDWQKAQKGIGIPSLARLLGDTGHPVRAVPHTAQPNPDYDKDEPASEDNQKTILFYGEPFDRTVSQWWSYCGHGDANRRRRKGMSDDEALALGRPKAKMRVHLMAADCVKVGITRLPGVEKGTKFSPDTRKATSHYGAVYLDRRTKTWDREDWTDNHKNNDAIRITAKEILRDLWLAARA